MLGQPHGPRPPLCGSHYDEGRRSLPQIRTRILWQRSDMVVVISAANQGEPARLLPDRAAAVARTTPRTGDGTSARTPDDACMAELDPAELATVLDAAERYLSDSDWDGAYNLLYPVSEANAATGADLGRLNFDLGEACIGLDSFDAAWRYYQAALGLQSGRPPSAPARGSRAPTSLRSGRRHGRRCRRRGRGGSRCWPAPRTRSSATTSRGTDAVPAGLGRDPDDRHADRDDGDRARAVRDGGRRARRGGGLPPGRRGAQPRPREHDRRLSPTPRRAAGRAPRSATTACR